MVSFFQGGIGPRVGGLVLVLVVFAGVVLLVRGYYHKVIFTHVMAMNRWTWRVGAYAALMTDEYPPFRLAIGEE